MRRSRSIIFGLCLVAVVLVCTAFFIREQRQSNKRDAVNAEASLELSQGDKGDRVFLVLKNLGPAPLLITQIRVIDKARDNKTVLSYDPRKYLSAHDTSSPSRQSFPLDQLSSQEYWKTRGYDEKDYLMAQGVARDETGKEFRSNTLSVRFPKLTVIPPYIQ